ncbi:questin oxidase family protein [Devosia sp. 2618]|uniref:questin oxidase family protein n=1 Tax=Devosia sp. 2618 TaxID=3156454 RepID=UPI003397B07A
MANHLPMVLVIMDRAGAPATRMEEFCEQYRVANNLQLVTERMAAITPQNWRDFLGQREREADFRAFFAAEVAHRGGRDAARHYLPILYEGFAASAIHAFMRMAYAAYTNNDTEIAIALAYWSSTYLCLGVADGSAPTTREPLDVLKYMYGPDAFRGVKTEIDLLWHNMRAISGKSEFGPVVNMLEIDDGTLARLANASLTLFASTEDFSALHALTGAHWLRFIEPYSPDNRVAMRYFWQAISALVPKIGFPVLASREQLDEWRNLSLPDWPELFAEALKHSMHGASEAEEHDLSLTFSASQEFKLYGDRLYQYVTARRLKLI